MRDRHQPEVSIVIPVFNSREMLEKLLASIARQSVAPVEVIVVDNGSTDGAPEAAARTGARVVAMGRNAGFAAAVNRGIQEAKCEWIALLNSDVELGPLWLETLATQALGSGDWFATGKILQAGQGDMLDGSYDLICRGGCAWRAGAGQPASREPGTATSIRFCSATATIYAAEVFRKVGLFEEAFESYLEDVDLGLRCAAAELKGTYLSTAVCRHHGSATFGRWHPRVVRLISRNQVLLLARNYSGDMLARWWWPILVAHGLWGLLAIRHGCGFAWLRGKIAGIWRFRSVRRQTAHAVDLSGVLVESESQIHELQSEAGFDWYWKMYFRLAGVAK